MLKVGSNSIGKVYFGSNPIGKAYLGSNLVYSGGTVSPPFDSMVEYLQSDGLSYIDTGVNLRSVTVATYTVSFSQVPSTTCVLYGIYYDNTTAERNQAAYINDGKWSGTDTSYTQTTGVAQNANVVANTTYSITATQKNAVATDATMYFFARHNDTGSPLPTPYMRVYSLQITQGGVLVRDFIPVRRGQTGYLYDRISGSLFGNIGSGTFSYGQDKTVTSITASVISGAVIVDTMGVNDLTPYLVVTAYYDDTTHSTVSDYSLSGSISLGQNTVTVSYGGVTTTVSVTAVHNYAGALSTWTLHPSQSVSEYTNGYIRMKCLNAEDQSGWGVWCADCKKTLWSAVNGKTVKIRVKTNEASFGTIGTFGIGVYQNANITSLGSAYAKRKNLNTSFTIASDGYYECVFENNYSNLDSGSLTPNQNSTYGMFCYARALNDYVEIYDVQIIEVV